MACTNNIISNLTILFACLALIVLLFCMSITPLTSKFLFSNQEQEATPPSNSSLMYTLAKDELEECLNKASMEDKTVIITIINKAYIEPQENFSSMFDLFLEGFWIGEDTRQLLDHVMVVALDESAYDRCKFKRLNCYKLVTNDSNYASEKLYMSQDFINMMWERTFFLLGVLKRGHNFIFTDTDVIWLRNPLPRLNINVTEDLQISTDHYLGDPWSESNPINTGFYRVMANNKTCTLFETWYNSRENATGLKEQDVLANLIGQGVIRKLGLKVRFLDTLYFSGFCSDSEDIGGVVTVHANCCRSISAKVADLSLVIADWKRFRRLGRGEAVKNSSDVQVFGWSKHIACANSWGVIKVPPQHEDR